MSRSVAYNDGWAEGRKALLDQLAALPRFVLPMQGPGGFHANSPFPYHFDTDQPVMHSVVKWDQVEQTVLDGPWVGPEIGGDER